MVKKAVKLALGILLLLVVLVMCLAGGGYLYLKPEKEPPRLASNNTVRVVENGELIGFESKNDTYAWLGIPYAAPPVGELRWKAPRPPERWTDRLEALEFGSICSQTGWDVFNNEKGLDCSEDCLYLNVWAPAYKNGSGPVGQRQFPVMVWIHGGYNTSGHSSRIFFNGAAMAGKHNVVVVSINYRLGPFGWFTHPALRSEEAPPEDNSGNYGTLDIIQALKWVQNNIIAFGGDPGNVTIYGESAGGANVLCMMASPLAKGLFHRAISQSGESGGLRIIPVSVAENYLDDEFKGDELSSKEIVNHLLVNDGAAADRDEAKKLQEDEPVAKIAAYLYGKSPEEIFAAYKAGGGLKWCPNLFGDGYVLPEDMTTAEIFSDITNYNSVPVILGTNRDEAKLFLMLDNELVDKAFGVLPVGFIDDVAYETVNRYASELWKIHGVDSLASLMREVQGERIFAYRFDADDWRDLGFIDLQKLLGAAHAMEIPFVFGNFPNLFRGLCPDSTVPERNRLSDSMMSYWAEFAYTGDPGRGRSGKEVAWTSWQNGDKNRLRLLILDTELDRGIRMSSEWATMAGLKAKFLSETGFRNQKTYCDVYKYLFRGDDFIQSEYENLGNGGCTE